MTLLRLMALLLVVAFVAGCITLHVKFDGPDVTPASSPVASDCQKPPDNPSPQCYAFGADVCCPPERLQACISDGGKP